jgi:serine/threonine protein kinase
MKPDESHNEKVDVWSYGMVLYEITTNRIPYDNCENVAQVVTAISLYKETPKITNEKEVHPTLFNLMKQCWNWDPQQRPSFSQIVQTLRKSLSSK